MAKRGPGRLKPDATLDQSVDILNGEVPHKNPPTQSPKKRKGEKANESSPNSKRRATERRVEEFQERRKSTRLAHPRASTEQRQSGNSGSKRNGDLFEGPKTPPPSSKTTKAMKSPGKAKPVLDKENGAFEADEGEEDAANPMMRSPADNTRNFDKRIGRIGRVRDDEKPSVNVQPVKMARRRQRLLTNGSKSSNGALTRPLSAPSQGPEKPSAELRVQEERGTLPAGGPERENGTGGNQTSTDEAPREHQSRTSTAEEPVNSVENQSGDRQPDGSTQSSSTTAAFERASGLHDCKKSWESMMEANRENLGSDDGAGQATEIRELAGLIKSAKLAYLAIRQADGVNMETKDYEIEELLVFIDEGVRTIRATKKRKRDSRLIKDVYVQGIPNMVKLLKAALVTRSLENELSIASLKELVKIIDTTLILCAKAYNWRPRPTLDSGVMRRTRNVIKPSLEALRKAYTEAQYDYPDEEEDEARKVEKRQALAVHVANFLAQEQEKKKRAEYNKRWRQRDRTMQSVIGDRLQTREFDVDELDLNGVSPAPAMGGVRGLTWRETGVAAARQSLSYNNAAQPGTRYVPRMSRERTEDIPGPMARKWSEDEDGALLKGLEEFTDANRYLEIDQVYGSAGGPLSGRDVDELMQRARFYKQSMASHIEEERDNVGNVDRWAYLLSVEG